MAQSCADDGDQETAADYMEIARAIRGLLKELAAARELLGEAADELENYIDDCENYEAPEGVDALRKLEANCRKSAFKQKIDSLSVGAKTWLHNFAQQINDSEADGFIDNPKLREECLAAGVVEDWGGGEFGLSGVANGLLYSDNYLAPFATV